MNIELVYFKSSHEDWAELVEESYVKKISRFFPFKVRALKSRALPRQNAKEKVKQEEAQLLQIIKTNDYVILFDEKGKSFEDSLAFSSSLVKSLESGRSQLRFIIGGPFGVGDAIKSRADLKVSLSGLTFNHFVAKTVVMEQVYRALTIWKNIPYHNQ